ncbi:MAG TPA: tetratricopeptide repeat protein [Allosphingosinicella sp.]|nr:tetratricopeptide repeat protein [Allosphingosinicella sp.]
MKPWLASTLPLMLLAPGCSNAPAAGNPYSRGVAALEKGDARTARVEFLNVIKADPASKAARIMQARTYLKLGDGIAAEAEADRARALGVATALTSPLKAHALLLQDRPADALQVLADASGAYAEWMRARAHDALGEDAEAAKDYERATALAPRDAAIWTDAARFRRSTGALADAMQAADRAVAADPANVEALTLRGELTRGQYGLRAALPWFDRAIEIDDSHVNAHLERAATLGEMGAMHAMLAETRKVLALSPKNAMAFYLQAVLAARAGDFGLARSLYQRTQGRMDGRPAAMLLESAIDYAAGDPRQAAGRLAALAQMQPYNRKALRLLAAARWKAGDIAGTIAAVQPLADRPDADSYSLSLMGDALAKLGKGREAASYLARAAHPGERAASALFEVSGDIDALRGEAQANPGDAPAQIALIRALLNDGRNGEALARARALAGAYPGTPDAHMLVGDALAVQGDDAAAADAYRKAANIAFTEPVAMRMIDALDRSGQAGAASDVLGLFLQQNPRSVPAQLLAAARYMAARQWGQAIRIYETLRVQTGDNDAMMLNNLAWAYAEQGDYRSALPLAKRAWQLDRDNPGTADTFGWLLFKSGIGKPQGLILLERAANAAPQLRGHNTD